MGLFSSIVRELYSVTVDDRNTCSMEERRVVKVAVFSIIMNENAMFAQVHKFILVKTFQSEVFSIKGSKHSRKIMEKKLLTAHNS